MPATEKNANSFSMTSLSAVNSGYSLMLINNSTNEGQLVTMTDLATMILNEIRNKTFTATELGRSSASTLPAAISSLNSAMIPYVLELKQLIPANADLNDYHEAGAFYCHSIDYTTLSNSPITNGPFRLDVIDTKPRGNGTRYKYAYQNLVPITKPWKVFRRYCDYKYATDSWVYTGWYLIEGTPITE